MNPHDTAAAIVSRLDAVASERRLRAGDATLASRSRAVREYQARRMRQTHADLLASPTTRAAALFFLGELYGEQDFLERDAQFRRVVPALVRLFSAQVVQTVDQLAELHALSERLDTRMAQAFAGEPPLDDARYAQAWRTVGEPGSRTRQIELVGHIGEALVLHTRHPTLGRALRMMRLPARAAGLLSLQGFLERGFDTFAAMPDPQGFLDTVCTREARHAAQLFEDAGDNAHEPAGSSGPAAGT